MPFLSFRLFNTYGKNFNFESNYTGVIGKFISNHIKNKKLIIYGNGNQTRSFVHVDDVCRVLIKGAESKYSYKIFNLGSKNYISIKQLAKKISKNIKYIPEKKETLNIQGVKKKIRDYLNFSPKIKLDVGIKSLMNYYKIND